MAPDAVLAGASGAMRDIGSGEIHAGTPALPGREFFGQIAAVRRMPKVLDDLKDLKKRIALLEQQILEKQVAAK